MMALTVIILFFLVAVVAVIVISAASLFVKRRSTGSGSVRPRVGDDVQGSMILTNAPLLVVSQDFSQPMPSAPDSGAPQELNVQPADAPVLLENPDPLSLPDTAPPPAPDPVQDCSAPS